MSTEVKATRNNEASAATEQRTRRKCFALNVEPTLGARGGGRGGGASGKGMSFIKGRAALGLRNLARGVLSLGFRGCDVLRPGIGRRSAGCTLLMPMFCARIT